MALISMIPSQTSGEGGVVILMPRGLGLEKMVTRSSRPIRPYL